MNRMKKAYIPFATVAVALVLTIPAHADVPQLLNYQGRLTDPSGNPKNGTFTMQLAVYDAVSGGNQLPTGSPWSETQSVMVTNGVFNVLLGSVTPLPADLFEGGPADSAGPLRFVQVTVGGEPLAPRRRIVSAAYALNVGSSAPAIARGNVELVGATGSAMIDTGFRPHVITVFMTAANSSVGTTGTSFGSAFDGPSLTQSCVFATDGGPNSTGNNGLSNSAVGQSGSPSAQLTVTSIADTGFSYAWQKETGTVGVNFHWVAYRR